MKPPKTYRFHPACLAFPLLPDAELQELADDIKLRGLMNPVVLHQGQVLDGRNRLAACEIAGVAPRFTEWSGGGSPVEWVVSINLHRRHLSASQRAVVALDLLPLLESEAKERQRRSQGRGKKVAKKCATYSGKASEAAARLARSNSRYVEVAKAIQASALEVIEKVRSGQLSVPNARRVADLPPAQRDKVLREVNGQDVGRHELDCLIKKARLEARHEQAKKARKPGGDQNLLVGDMGILWNRLQDDSVDLFLTDPVYHEIGAYQRLAELAAAKLKPGGLCLAYCGQMYLPQVLAAMTRHLQYFWTFVVTVADQPKPIFARSIQAKWKPVVAFAKRPIRPAANWLADLLDGGGRDDRYHQWGQTEVEAVYLIQRLTEPGQLVVDPYAGGGAFIAACKATHRRWLATERDEATAHIARQRLAEIDDERS
jgi:hypothetical protein